MSQFDSRLGRRKFLAGGLSLAGGAALLPLAPNGFSARRAENRRLVVIELFGGNDGLDTIVPYANDAYHRARPTLARGAGEVLRIDDERGFHPSMRKTRALMDAGQVAIVEGCGYPKPVLSHFKSLEIWHTGRTVGRASGDGWLGRLRGEAWGKSDAAELVTHIGGHTPYSVHSALHTSLVFKEPDSYVFVGDARERDFHARATARGAGAHDGALARLRRRLHDADATSARVLAAAADYEPRVEYPGSSLGSALRTVAGMIESGFDTRVFSVSLGNFDTHGPVQRNKRAALLTQFDGALGAFLADLRESTAGANTSVLVYSEFGRRVAENQSRGTDHGAAGPMFLFGESVAGGLYGAPSSLEELDADGNLIHTTDFRRVFASVLSGWFGVRAERVLGREWPSLPLFSA